MAGIKKTLMGLLAPLKGDKEAETETTATAATTATATENSGEVLPPAENQNAGAAFTDTASADAVSAEFGNSAPPVDDRAEFDAEFGGSDDIFEAAPAGSDSAGLQSQEQAPAPELEELSEPLPEMPHLPVLEEGAVLSEGEGAKYSVRILSLEESRPGLNIYRAQLHPADAASGGTEQVSAADAGGEKGREARLREASGVLAERLKREAAARSGRESPMLPAVLDCFDREDKTYLLEEAPATATTFESLLGPSADLSEVVHVLAQVSAAVMQLHSGGWACLGLRPSSIALGKPVQLTDFTFVAPLGEASPPLSLAGYSAPELATGAVTDVRMDVYSIGALLYAATSDAAVPETGADLQFWVPPAPLPGVPQILHRCLGTADTRYNTVEELRRDLVQLKNRLKPAVSYTVAAASTIGLEPGRSTNQDAFCHLSGTLQSESGALPWAMLCVADGMGGMAAGEVASEVAVQTVLKEAAAAFSGGTLLDAARLDAAKQAERTREWARSANESVVNALEQRGARGGCTFVCASVVGQSLTIAHVGDCRIYHIRGQELQQLTHDHSFVMALVQQGEITKDEIRTHPDRNKVARSMGDRHPMPDYFVDTLEVATGQVALELQPGDVVLLCSDGLWEPVLEDEIQVAIARHSPDLQGAIQEMLQIALERGAPDNATVALLRADSGKSVDEQ